MKAQRSNTYCKPRAIGTNRGWLCVALAVISGALIVTTADDALARTKSKPAAAVAKPHAGRGTKPKTRVAAAAPIESDTTSSQSKPRESDPIVAAPLLSRDQILNADAGRLERVGRHLIVGYRDFSDIKALVEKRLIAGIFITAHNVRRRSAADMKADIDRLQEIRKTQGLPPLIIAADQEGGAVSRLSPPLKRQTTLARLLADLPHDDDRRKAVEAYADVQARELKRIGVTLNFAPVVDLKLNPSNRNDGETRLRARAIAADPYLVAKVAGWYCDTVAASGIMCTLKHFPGLGRVARDTHVSTGDITASGGQLELNDWVPFRRVMSKSNVAVMLGHVRVEELDKTTPASFSRPVVRDLIRNQWGYDGLLVTDDFCMGAVTKSKGGVGAAAVKSLDAGVDLILISDTERHFRSVVSALIAADAESSLDASATGASRNRMDRIIKAAMKPAAAKTE